MLEPDLSKLLRNYILGVVNPNERSYVKNLLLYDAEARIEFEKIGMYYPQKFEYFKLQNSIQQVGEDEFNTLAGSVLQYQLENNEILRRYVGVLKSSQLSSYGISLNSFLPVELFKSNIIKSGAWLAEDFFLSSGTLGQIRSRHEVRDLNWYRENSWRIFSKHILNSLNIEFNSLNIFGLLPGYIDNQHSSLLSMLNGFGLKSGVDPAAMFFNNMESLYQNIILALKERKKIILFGVSFALLDFALKYSIHDSDLFIIETGGMKTDRRSLTKNEILERLQFAFSNSKIMSEYGMTELFSQAYALDGINYICPNTMRIVITELEDPLQEVKVGKRGRINIIDLANLDTCSFLQTGDVGIVNNDGSFQVLGRFEEEELRGCNLMYDNGFR